MNIIPVKRNYIWKDGKTLSIGNHALIMGILNVTPDSFSDGGNWNTKSQARIRTVQMIKEGAALIDVGAESTRPGSTPLSAKEEWERLIHFLPEVLKNTTVPLSVDTYHYENADKAMSLGAHIMNDIWGLQSDDGSMARVAAEHQCPVIVMHNQEKEYAEKDIIENMKCFFDKSIHIAQKFGIKDENIILDPGIGFGKTREQDLEVLQKMDQLVSDFSYPWLLAASRKRIVGNTLGITDPTQRDEGTGAISLWGIEHGCFMVRVHNVALNFRLIRMWEALHGVKGE